MKKNCIIQEKQNRPMNSKKHFTCMIVSKLVFSSSSSFKMLRAFIVALINYGCHLYNVKTDEKDIVFEENTEDVNA